MINIVQVIGYLIFILTGMVTEIILVANSEAFKDKEKKRVSIIVIILNILALLYFLR